MDCEWIVQTAWIHWISMIVRGIFLRQWTHSISLDSTRKLPKAMTFPIGLVRKHKKIKPMSSHATAIQVKHAKETQKKIKTGRRKKMAPKSEAIDNKSQSLWKYFLWWLRLVCLKFRPAVYHSNLHLLITETLQKPSTKKHPKTFEVWGHIENVRKDFWSQNNLSRKSLHQKILSWVVAPLPFCL